MSEVANDKSEEKLQLLSTHETSHLLLSYKISADKLKLFVDARLRDPMVHGGVSSAELTEHLPSTVPSHFVHTEVLDDITQRLNLGHHISDRRIAKGKAPIAGRDGRLVLLVKKYVGHKSYTEHEVVDRRFIRFFDNLEKGTSIGRLYPPDPGSDGKTVLGEVLSANTGKPLRANIDTKTISIEPTQPGAPYENLVAQLAGYLTEERSQITVKNELVISANVDYRIGDIDFVGSVKVNGDVGQGFHITAREKIEISGDVSGGILNSKQGSIVVKGNISASELESVSGTGNASSGVITDVGSAGAKIASGAELSVNLASGVELEANGNIEIVKEARHCLIRTKAVLSMPTGHLFASEVYSVCGVEIGLLGSEAGSRTVIHLCSDVESTHDYFLLTEQIYSHYQAYELIKASLGPHVTHTISELRLKPDHALKLKNLRKKLTQIELALRKLNETRDQLLAGARKNDTFRVNILKQAFPGVIIEADGETYEVAAPLKGPKTIEYSAETKQFTVKDLVALECNVRNTLLKSK